MKTAWKKHITVGGGALFILLSMTVARGADESSGCLTVQPGVIRVGSMPESWVLDLRETASVPVEAQARGLSSRLYGPAHGPLHEPLRILTDFQEPRVLGLHVTGLAREEVELDV